MGGKEGFGCVPRGNSSLRATKYDQREGHRLNRHSVSGNWFYFPYSSKEHTARSPAGLCSVPPRAPPGWSPPHARIQETAPDAGNRAQPPLDQEAPTSERDHRARGLSGVPGCCGERLRRQGAVPRWGGVGRGSTCLRGRGVRGTAARLPGNRQCRANGRAG